jgi:c-di-GMP-binding flagellar brake protein YcgR
MDSSQSDSEQGAPAAEGGAKERRAYPRADNWGTAWLGIFPEGTKVLCYLVDLGVGGCHVEADAAIPASDNAHVEVLLQLKDSTLRLAGVIRHMEENQTRAGVEFTDLSPRKAEQIQRLIDHLFAESE